jgi:hypothetical protein
VQVAEPSTLASDYVLGLWTALLAWRLHRRAGGPARRAVALWVAALAAASGGSFAGGTYHGFGPAMPPGTAARLWTFTTLLVGAASFFLLASAVAASFTGPVRRWGMAAAAAKAIVYGTWMLWHDAFLFVIVDYAVSLLVVLTLAVTGRLRGAEGWRSPVVGGVAVTLAAAGLQQSGIDLHRHFNHNDLQHVVQMGAIWLLFRAGLRLRDKDAPAWNGAAHAG